jgi:hypothetical protein
MINDWKKAREMLRLIQGLECHVAWIGIGSFLTLEFGDVHTETDGYQRRDYLLWLYESNWSIRSTRQTIAFNDSLDIMNNGARLITSACCTTSTIRNHDLGTVMRFSSGVSLVATSNMKRLKEDFWLLYLPDYLVGVARGTSSFRVISSVT